MSGQLLLLEPPALSDQLVLELPEKKQRGKPKQNRKGDKTKSLKYDRCNTPPIALHPLLPFLRPFRTIWESADGKGYLSGELERLGWHLERSDVLIGRNFYSYQPALWDVQVTNPPYSDKFGWIEHSFELGKPFALLVPTETISALACIQLYRHYGVFGTVEFMTLDQRVNFDMPEKGFERVEENGKKWKSSAQFPVIWLTHQLLPRPVMDGHIPRSHERNQLVLDFL